MASQRQDVSDSAEARNCSNFNIKPWFHVQLLHAISLESGGASCQSLPAPQCVSGVTSVFTSKMSDEDELLLLSVAASAATIALAALV